MLQIPRARTRTTIVVVIRCLIALVASALALPLSAQRPSTATEADIVLVHGKIITVDSLDRVLVAGAFQGGLDFGIGVSLVGAGGQDIFVGDLGP